jgi:hypothetical protein
MTEEDAFTFIVDTLRSGKHPGQPYDYDLCLRTLLAEKRIAAADSKPFYDAAWELCRRGILRVGGRGSNSQDAVPPGDGFSLTSRGREWLEQAGHFDYLPVEPTRFGRMLSAFTDQFGAGYAERSQEALRAYAGHAYLACCAMCGAAAESILLAIAVAKSGDEAQVLRRYEAAQGRRQIENLIFGQKREALIEGYRGCASLLKYWRDAASHGTASRITETEAFTSLALLLRLAQFAHAKWDELTT